jgi:hypothetical protein
VAPGTTAVFRAVLRNPSARALQARLSPRLPPGWRTQDVRIEAAAGKEAVAEFRVRIPSGAQGLQVVTADVSIDGQTLREWCEAVVVVEPKAR